MVYNIVLESMRIYPRVRHNEPSEEPAISTFVTPLLIYVLTPIVGLSAYLVLLQRMKSANVVSPPNVPFFILFFTLGGCLTVLLTAWFWEWSGSVTGSALFDLNCARAHGMASFATYRTILKPVA
jgi:hypothetical protein